MIKPFLLLLILPYYGSHEKISIAGLKKDEVLQALFARALHISPIIPRSSDILSDDEIKKVKKNKWRVGYMKDRALKIKIRGNSFNPRFFDEANGQNAAQQAIEALRMQKNDGFGEKK